jgi:transcriptional/translational regulatory protein YebC/TACO1
VHNLSKQHFKSLGRCDLRYAHSHPFSGNLGASGSLAWVFEKKGFISFDHNNKSEEEIMDVALEAGAEDFEYGKGDSGNEVHVRCRCYNVK